MPAASKAKYRSGDVDERVVPDATGVGVATTGATVGAV
jgi:hypothetical protein